jgi:enamine deaminase RidA (YjgF/YER057c/UK114 family)
VSRARAPAISRTPSLACTEGDRGRFAGDPRGRSAHLHSVTGGDREGLVLDAAGARDLLTRAEVLTGDGDLVTAVEDVLAGAEQAGADRSAVEGLLGALRILDPGAGRRYDPGQADDLRANTGYASEVEFLEGVGDAEDQVRRVHREAAALCAAAGALLDEAVSANEAARSDLSAARARLSAAYAMPAAEPCTGCHGAKQAAITEAETAAADAEARIGISVQVATTAEAAIAVLEPFAAALVIVAARLRRVPSDLGEAYELVYAFLRSGGKLPPFARWHQGSHVVA